MLEPKNHPLAPVNGDQSPTPRGALTLSAPPPLVLGEAAPAHPPGLSGGPTLSSLAQAIRRRWLLAFGVALLGAAGTVVAILTLWPAKYTATAKLQVASRTDSPVFAQTDQEEDFLTFKTNIAAALKSQLFLNRVIKSEDAQKLGLIRDNAAAAEWLSESLKTDFKGPGILEIKLSGDHPAEVAELLNIVVRDFIKELRAKDTERRREKMKELQASYNARKSKLDRKRVELRNLEAQHNVDDLETAKVRFAAILARRSAAEKDLSDCGREQTKLEQELRYLTQALKELPERPITDKQLDDFLAQDPLGQGVALALAAVQKDIAEVVSRGVLEPTRSQLINSYNRKKAELEKTLAKLRNDERPELERKIRSAIAHDIAFKQEVAKSKLESLRKEETFLQSKVRSIEEEANKANPSKRPSNMVTLADEIREEEGNLQKMSEKIAAWAMEPLAAGRVTILQEAQEPTGKDMSRHYKVAGAAGFGVFGMLLFGVALIEFRRRRISTATEISEGLGMSLVGTLPPVPAHARKNHEQNRLTEAVDGLRTMLLHAARTEKLHMVMVTSALSREGKTTLASQLAASLARAWRKTLLIDGDLRNPAAHTLFDLPPEPGLCEVLRGEVAANDAVRPTSLSRLWLLPAGHFDAHAVQALAQENVHDLFEQLKQQYDFIIVDSSPVLPVADALLLGQHADGVLLSVLRDVSRTPAVYAAQQRLHNLGIRTLGAVVIGDPGGAADLAYQYPARST